MTDFINRALVNKRGELVHFTVIRNEQLDELKIAFKASVLVTITLDENGEPKVSV